MLMAWLLWIFCVVGGFFMGSAALLSLKRSGFDWVLAANAALYLGTGLYGLPRLLRLVRKLL